MVTPMLAVSETPGGYGGCAQSGRGEEEGGEMHCLFFEDAEWI